jgi:S1-C subfamily serine protease
MKLSDRSILQNKGRALPVLLVLLVAATAAWYMTSYRPPHDPDARPRVVTARGNLAEDELNSVELFESVSPSVAYITSIEVRRSLFSLNVYEIPQGTGSGFIWDTEGRIVTNYHVVEDASRLEVTLADHSTWKGIIVGVTPDKVNRRT